MDSVTELSEEERRALRGSKFAPLPVARSNAPQTRLAHPGGALTTNKAAALAKFLERKLQDPAGLQSLDPELVERAVSNAKAAIHDSSSVKIRHVSSFSDEECTPSDTDKRATLLRPSKKIAKKKSKKKKKRKG